MEWETLKDRDAGERGHMKETQNPPADSHTEAPTTWGIPADAVRSRDQLCPNSWATDS